jgi:hypothetical protein
MSLKDELQTEQASHLDRSNFCQAASGTSVREVLTLMRETGSTTCLVMANVV